MDRKQITGKKAQSRKKIMHAAKYLFENQGIENVTFWDIAREAEVCRTTVFNHFAGTDELLIAMFEQEIKDIEEYCGKSGCRGIPLIGALFDKLIEDTALYPVLTFRIASSTILRGDDEENSLRRIEAMIAESLPEDALGDKEMMTVAIMGAYYGLVNHYHSLNKTFDAAQMKAEFHLLLQLILGGKEK